MRQKPQAGTPHAGHLVMLLTEAAWGHLSGRAFLRPHSDVYSETALARLAALDPGQITPEFFSLSILDVWSQMILS